jgi:dihydroorotate dehydrogenase
VSFTRPWLWISASLAHKISPTALNALTVLSPKTPPRWRSFEWRGLEFPNRLGIAGGVDKNAENIRAWWALGCGFVEIGTVTPRPQPGNTPPVVSRFTPKEALWNRMGFPSHGADKVLKNLKKITRPYQTPVFANIGKNAMTSLEGASEDYLLLMQKLHTEVDGFVVNISSPNTKGLRELLKPERLNDFLDPLLTPETRRSTCGKPVLLKLSPDLSDSELESALEVSLERGVDGWILTNTSQGLREGLNFPDEGGVSGRPLAARSREFLQKSLRILGKRRDGKLLISVGGVMSPADVEERLSMGADLVQVYAALIFQGPWFLKKVAQCLQIQPNRVPL